MRIIQQKKVWSKVIGFLVVVLLCLPIIVSAQVRGTPGPSTATTGPIPTFTNPLKFNSIEKLIFGLVDIALQLGVVVAALALIWVGFKYVAARGNPKKIAEAHQAFLYTIIGIAVLFGSKVIVTIIQGTIEPLAPELFKNVPKP